MGYGNYRGRGRPWGSCNLYPTLGSLPLTEGPEFSVASDFFLESPPLPEAVLEQRWAFTYLCGRAHLDPFTLLLYEGPDTIPVKRAFIRANLIVES